MVGYLPETDVETYTDWDSAKQSMIDYMEREGDFYFDSDDDEYKALADEISSEQQDLNLDNGPEWGTIVGNVSYWITPVWGGLRD